ncbi:MAG: bifunctional nuclease family protein [Acidimicrobiales bacterium]
MEATSGPTDTVDASAPTDTVDTSAPTDTVDASGRFRLVRLVSVAVTLPDQFPTVVVEDIEEHHRQLCFRVGMAEGAAIASALEGRTPPRPLTHDLFATTMERFSIDVLAVRLTGRIGTTYLAELDLVGPHGREVLSCRPSDGICLALRRRLATPVLADERLFHETGDVYPEVADASPPAHD